MTLTRFPHHQKVTTFVLRSQEDLWNNNQYSAPLVRSYGPCAFHVGWIVSRKVGTLKVALELTHHPPTLVIWKNMR